MRKISVDDMFSGKKSRYALVIGVAKRARQIAHEYEEAETILDKKPVLMAIQDFKEHKFSLLEPEEND